MSIDELTKLLQSKVTYLAAEAASKGHHKEYISDLGSHAVIYAHIPEITAKLKKLGYDCSVRYCDGAELTVTHRITL